MIYPTSILRSLDLAQRALTAQQTALDTIGQNISNVATPGYTRQRADLVPVSPRGVDVQQITRLRDRFLDASLVLEQQNLGKSQAQDGLLQRLQEVFNDPSATGLGPAIDQFFNAFQDLATNPSDPAVRVTVRDQGARVASTLQQTREHIVQITNDATTEIQQRVDDANALIGHIADLNRQIIAARGTSDANALLDQRDKMVEDLTQIVGVTITDQPNGGVQLAMTGTGLLLVDGTDTAPLRISIDPATDTVNLTAGAAATPVVPKGGALAGVMELRNDPSAPLKQAVSQLDQLAATLIADVNRVHASGTGLTEPSSVTAQNAVSSSTAALTAAGLPLTPTSGSFEVIVHDASGAVVSSVTVAIVAGTTTLANVATAIAGDTDLTASISGGKLTIGAAAAGNTIAFAADSSDTLAALGLNGFFTGTDASTIALDPGIAADASTIAAARADAAGLVHPGDGANALDIARLATGLAMGGGSQTYAQFYGSLVATVGAAAKSATDTATRQQSAVQLVQGLQQQTSGVSTDEELIKLNQSQTAYAAAARFATTINDVIATLLAMATT